MHSALHQASQDTPESTTLDTPVYDLHTAGQNCTRQTRTFLDPSTSPDPYPIYRLQQEIILRAASHQPEPTITSRSTMNPST
mmetsp:Transcript_145610/g.254186  ORF Transcript_145610/g.254186 Transcript_145610/m.254186 type:complete len:82 (+) Transcript_145610:560-805(+)